MPAAATAGSEEPDGMGGAEVIGEEEGRHDPTIEPFGPFPTGAEPGSTPATPKNQAVQAVDPRRCQWPLLGAAAGSIVWAATGAGQPGSLDRATRRPARRLCARLRRGAIQPP
jgi:hypothetical protein